MAALQVVLVVTVLCGAAVAVLGGYLVLADLADGHDTWHGLGIVLGLFGLVPGVCAVLLAAAALRHRRTAPGRTRLLAAVLGGTLTVSFALVSSIGSAVTVPMLLLGLVLLALAWAAGDSGRRAG